MKRHPLLYVLMLLLLLPFIAALQAYMRHAEAAPPSEIPQPTQPIDNQEVDQPQTEYSEPFLRRFLDSLVALPSTEALATATRYPDSICTATHSIQEDRTPADIALLRKALPEGELDLEVAKRLFPDTALQSYVLPSGRVPVNGAFFPSLKGDSSRFAAFLGPAFAWDCNAFFFEGNRMLASQRIFHRYGMTWKYFNAEDGMPVIYWRENLESGTGIWAYQYCFLKYHQGKVIPVLNTPQETNLQYPWRNRTMVMNLELTSQRPLIISGKYEITLHSHQMKEIPLKAGKISQSYTWDAKTLRYIPSGKTDLTALMYAASLYQTDRVFVQQFAPELRALLDSKNIHKQQAALNCLQDIANNLLGEDSN